MTRIPRARTRFASGRCVWLCLALGACQLAGTVPRPGAAVWPVPVIAPGPISSADEEEAEALLGSAETSLGAARYFEALRTASELIQRFPASSVSGRALLLGARAELGAAVLEGGEAGLAALRRADAAAERYLSLLQAGDPRAAEARLIQAEALAGSPALRLDRLLTLDASAPEDAVSRALPMAREAADSLGTPQLEAALAGAPAGARLAHVPQTRLAVYRLEAGDSVGANGLARAALQGGATGVDSLLAEGVLRGELPEGRGRVTSATIATVLPVGGSPALADFARLIIEGVEVAAATVADEIDVQVVETDDEGDPVRAAELVVELEAEGVAGVIGFLEDLALEIAGLSRELGVPLLSPTARSAARAGDGVYSLGGPDPRAAQQMAAYAGSRGYRRVAIVHPLSPEATEEADAFQAAADSLGIPTVARFTYQPGATFFEPQILGARDSLRLAEIAALGLGENDTLRVEMLEPVGLFLPIPPEDVEFLAPQIRHFGLDTLAIEILGTAGWTDAQVLQGVDPLYTDGVIATAPAGAGPGSPGQIRFRVAYEQHFQRTLISPVPALGYDAALLLIEALRGAHGTAPEQVVASFEQLQEVEGATGTFSVVGDIIVRASVAGDSIAGIVGDSIVGDSIVGDSIVGDPIVGDSIVGDPIMGGLGGSRLIRRSEVVRIEYGELVPVDLGGPPPIG